MSVLEVGRRGFHRGYSSLSTALSRAIAGDEIVINQKKIVLDATCLINAGVTITGRGKEMVTIVTNPRNAGFFIGQKVMGEVKFRNIRLLVSEQSIGINSKATNVTLTFDHCDIKHSVQARTWYPSLTVDSEGNGALALMASQVDTITGNPYRVNMERSAVGDLFSKVANGFASYSILSFVAGEIKQSGLQNILLQGSVQGANLTSSWTTFGGNVQLRNLEAKLYHPRLRELPTITHTGNAGSQLAETTALIADMGSKLEAHNVVVDTNKLDSKQAKAYSIPMWRAFGVTRGGELRLISSKLDPAPVASKLAQGVIAMENVDDGNDWVVTNKKATTQNRNSKSLLYKAVQAAQNQGRVKMDGPISDTDSSVRAITKLEQMPGLKEPKKLLKSVISAAKSNAERKRRGLPYDNKAMYHMIFAGHAGTGKTTVARLFGQALYEEGFLKSTNFQAPKQKDLIAGYKGQTAKNTQEVIEQAMDGILFIDEAYFLAPDRNGQDTSFANESVATLIQAMANHPDRLVVILAGYTQPMRHLLHYGNEGLTSRIPYFVEFPDYTPKDMKRIMRYKLEQSHARIASQDTMQALDKGLDTLIPLGGPNAGNGRLVENYVNRVTGMRDTRIAKGDISKLSNKALMIINSADVENAVKVMSHDFEMRN